MGLPIYLPRRELSTTDWNVPYGVIPKLFLLPFSDFASALNVPTGARQVLGKKKR